MKPLQQVFLIDDDETTNYINHRTLAKANIARRIVVYSDAEEALSYLKKAIAALPGYTLPELCRYPGKSTMKLVLSEPKNNWTANLKTLDNGFEMNNQLIDFLEERPEIEVQVTAV